MSIVWFPEDIDEWFAGDFDAAEVAVRTWGDDDEYDADDGDGFNPGPPLEGDEDD